MVTCLALVSANPPSRRHATLARAAVALLAVVLYAGTLGHGFVYDDDLVVRSHTIVREQRFLRAFTTPYHSDASQTVETGLYRPLPILSFALQYALHDGRPAAYHAANVALHAIVSLLVLELALALGVPLAAAAGAGMLFAAHPVHVEAVAGIAGRAELLSAGFYLAALIVYIRRSSAAGRMTTALLIFLALLCKETAVTFPAAACGYSLLFRREKMLASAAAVVAPIAAYLVLRQAVLGALLVPAASMTFVENPLVGLGLVSRLATAVAICGRYAVLLVAPVRLSPDWGFAQLTPVSSPFDTGFLPGLATLGAACALFAATYRRRRVIAYLLLLLAVSYSIVSNTVVLIGIGMAERLLYLPSAAFCIAVALAIAWGAGRFGARIALALAAVLLVAAGARTVAAAATWRDDFTLFSAAETAAPRSVKILGNLAVELIAQGRLDEAKTRLTRAAALAPDHVLTRINLAGVLLKTGDLDGAEAEVAAALRLEPDHPVGLAQLGAILRKRGALREAEDALRRAVAANPRFVGARLDLASLLIVRQAWDEAERELREVLAIEPASAAAQKGLAIVAERRAAAAR